MWCREFIIVIVGILAPICQGLYEECNHVLQLNAGQKMYINSPYYPGQYPIGTSCRYVVKAPLDYQLKFKCELQLNSESSTSCENELFHFNREGKELLTESEFFCGSGAFERTSYMNQAAISYISKALNNRVASVSQTVGASSLNSALINSINLGSNYALKNKRPASNSTGNKGSTIKLTVGLIQGSVVPSILDNPFVLGNGVPKRVKVKRKPPKISGNSSRPIGNASGSHKVKHPISQYNISLATTSANSMPSYEASTAELPAALHRPHIGVEQEKNVNQALSYLASLLKHSNGIAPELQKNPNTSDILTIFGEPSTGHRRTATTTTPRKPSNSPIIDILTHDSWRLVLSQHLNNQSFTEAPSDNIKKPQKPVRRTKIVIQQLGGALTDPQVGYQNTGRFSCLVEVAEAPCECGWNLTPKIVGATGVASLFEFPSMAGIKRIDDNRIFCGAVIIHHRYLLSAAHCFLLPQTNHSELLHVVVGDIDLTTVFDSVFTRFYELETIIPHKQYYASTKNLRNDIAILKTRIPIEWNRNVGPACLPFRVIKPPITDTPRKMPYPGQRLETAGWGTTAYGGAQPSSLLKTTLDVMAPNKCRNAIRSVPPGVFCAFTPGHDTCQFDSGGGLYVRDGLLYVVGLVSYGFGCAGQKPSINTRVSSFLRWIQDQTPEVKYCSK